MYAEPAKIKQSDLPREQHSPVFLGMADKQQKPDQKRPQLQLAKGPIKNTEYNNIDDVDSVPDD